MQQLQTQEEFVSSSRSHLTMLPARLFSKSRRFFTERKREGDLLLETHMETLRREKTLHSRKFDSISVIGHRTHVGTVTLRL